MPVHIIPVGILRPSLPQREIALEAAGRTIWQILAELGIDPDLVAMVLINGRQAPKDAVLNDGDVVKLVPFVGGGRS
jgi:sulfur carrier protein ThiS